jgi:preprotein translocase subunit SecG
MAIYEIILCVVILLASVLVCAVTLSMDKADKNALGVINGLSGSMMKNSKDSNKNSANKLVAICTAILLVIAIVMFVVNGIGG